MTAHRIAASWLIPDAVAPAAGNRVITIADGRIAAVEDCAGKGGLVLPALASAHDHARVARLSQVGSFDVPLEAWLPYLALVPAVDPWLASAVAFGRIARGGVGSTMATCSAAGTGGRSNRRVTQAQAAGESAASSAWCGS